MSTEEDDDDPALERDVHETLLPSLHLSVLGGVGGVNSVGIAEPLTPLPEALSQPSLLRLGVGRAGGGRGARLQAARRPHRRRHR